MTVIQLAIRARPIAAPAVPQVTTATIFQFPTNAKTAPRDCYDDADYLTPAERVEYRARSAARHARRAAMARFGKRLRVVRAILGLSIEAAACAANVKTLSFKHYESGVTEMRTARLMAFVNHPTVKLGVLSGWLLEDGAPTDKEREIVSYCVIREIWNEKIHSAIAGLCRPVASI